MADRILNGFILSCLVVTVLVTVALGLTYVANKYEVRGLGWVGIGAWLIVAVVAVVLSRRKLPIVVGALLTPAWFIAALPAYSLIGYHAFGWSGLMK